MAQNGFLGKILSIATCNCGNLVKKEYEIRDIPGQHLGLFGNMVFQTQIDQAVYRRARSHTG
jgi:hypothetical protein